MAASTRTASSARPQPRTPSLQPPPAKRPSRIVIEGLEPALTEPTAAVKRCVGDQLRVQATIFRDGHEQLRALVRDRDPQARDWRETPLTRVASGTGDEWTASIPLERPGRWCWQVLAWVDRFASWQEEVRRKLDAAESSLESELAEGILLLESVLERATADDRELLEGALRKARAKRPAVAERATALLAPALAAAYARAADRDELTSGPALEVDVERVRARFGCWYELFPRSWGGFSGVSAQLPRFAALGVDVLYLPPIHPIGRTLRKGRNDAPSAARGDPGSPWAIGAAEGGHTAVAPELGTLEEFDALVLAAREHGIDIALDFAVQCSADHPWLSEHPEWFRHRPDGTLKYAENPPKRYRDIYNVDFGCDAWQELWQALRDVVLFWVEHGVRVFRVDNPHTKPLAFWRWLIDSVRAREPDVLFLAEAFTRPAMMYALARAGFGQSYTYFTWKNSAVELRDYVSELARAPLRDSFRANFFVNTPDILSETLQHGGPAAFASRLVLAATLSPSFGIYSGYENYENTARHPGSEEYADSEKYELKRRTLDGPLLPLLARLNRLRRQHPALQQFGNVRFLGVENDALIAYAKQTDEEIIICVVTLDPHTPQQGIVVIDGEHGLPAVFGVRDLLGGEHYTWQLGRNFVALGPERVAHVLVPVLG